MTRTYECELYLKDGTKYPEKFIEVAAAQDCYIEIGGDGTVVDGHEDTSNVDPMTPTLDGLFFFLVILAVLTFIITNIQKIRNRS